MSYNSQVIIIAGPTASGKTYLAHRLALRFSGEIISADSRQVYRFMDIGTAKPKVSLQRELSYHLIDVVNPDQTFTVADFVREANRLIEDILKRGRIPLIVGGCGLYIRALTRGLFLSPPPSPEIRKRLEKKGNLYERLKEVDPETAERVSPNDKKRIIRALEVFYQTEKPISVLQREETVPPKWRFTMFCLKEDRDALYKRIDDRVEEMVRDGWIEETERLLSMGYSTDLVSMEGLGYYELSEYIKKRMSLARAKEIIKRKTRQFAKRQMTWFRAEKRFVWLDQKEREERIAEAISY
jgi:tRNA dimethylallyltransferase